MTDMNNAAIEAVEQFNSSIAELFPQYICKAAVRNNLGLHVVVEFANVKSKDECASGILMNATGHMRFMMHLCDNRGKELEFFTSPIEIELIMQHYAAKRAGLKFRKIKGKTPADALAKLVAWFDKNQDIIKSI